MKTKPLFSLKASALFYVLLLSSLVAIILTAMISIWVFYRGVQQRDDALSALTRSADSGMSFLLSQPFAGGGEWSATGYFSPLVAGSLQFMEGSKEILQSSHAFLELSSVNWGLLRSLSVTAHSTLKGIPVLRKNALVGYAYQPKLGLLLPNNRQPLTLTGSSYLRADVQIGEVRINTANLNGTPYSGGTPFMGRSLPYTEGDEAINTFPNIQFTVPTGGRADLSEIVTEQSFQYPPLVSPLVKVLSLVGKNIRGKVVLRADSLIYVDKTTTLEDVILVAPTIQIDDDFSGSFQAFATHNILVGERVNLTYPSYMCLSVPLVGPRGFKGEIRCGDQFSLAGGLFLVRPPRGRINPYLVIGEQSFVRGTISCQGTVEIQGEMLGTIRAENFLYRADLRERINYIHNFQFEGPEPNPGAPWAAPLIETPAHKTIAKWVD